MKKCVQSIRQFTGNGHGQASAQSWPVVRQNGKNGLRARRLTKCAIDRLWGAKRLRIKAGDSRAYDRAQMALGKQAPTRPADGLRQYLGWVTDPPFTSDR
jgi:hypothetical protein